MATLASFLIFCCVTLGGIQSPAAELMIEFYRQPDQDKDKAQAPRKAILTTLEHHPEPIAWAAFTLMGSGN